MRNKLEQHWFSLPVLSGVLLVLSFHPFNLWLLGFFALAPLYYFAAGVHPLRRVWWGGFITGALFSFCLSYFTIVQFHWLPEAHLFASLVRLAVVPITLIGGAVCGLAMIAFHTLRRKSLLLNVALGAAVYAASELLLQCIFGGYYLAELAFVAVSLPALMWFAPLGGAALVSFIVAAINVLWAEAARKERFEWRPLLPTLLLFLALFLGGFCYAKYLAESPAIGSISVSLLQQGTRTEGQFGTRTSRGFSFPWLAEMLEKTSSQLVLYPFSPVEGALYRKEAPLNKEVLVASEKEFAAFADAHLKKGSTLLTWNTLYDGEFHNEYELWREGKVVAEYEKRAPFPFMDYTPAWAQRIGLYSTPFDVVAGGERNFSVGSVELGALLCSEVHSQSLARKDARSAPLIIAAGSEAMFEDPVASAFSLKAAQFRAAENHTTLVRGNVLGPSGIIAPSGSLIAYAPAGEEALLEQEIPLFAPRETLFNRLGPLLTLVLIFGILGATLWARYSR